MSDRIEDGGPAFPARLDATTDIYGRDVFSGLTARQYAAIHLRVPNSGTDWLDDMIRESLRDQMAGQALAGMLANQKRLRLIVRPEDSQAEAEMKISAQAYAHADAMLSARKGGQS